MSRYEQVKEILDDMDISELVAIHNEWCDAAGYMDNWIYPMDEFDEIMDGQSPWEIVRAAFFGEFNPTRDYFWFNGYANLESGDGWVDLPIDTSDIADFIVKNEESFGNSDIEDILDGTFTPEDLRYDDEEEEEE